MFEVSKRLKALPPYLFLKLEEAKRKAKSEGRPVIDLGVGDPDQPTPDYIIEALIKAVRQPWTHHYAFDLGVPVLRKVISDWYRKRFNVELDPETEVLPLIGSKEGIAHFPLAFLNPSDYALIPDPSYPPYRNATILAGGIPFSMPLKEENSFLPEFKKIPLSILKKAKIIFINYPNNPTTAVAPREFYRELIDFALRYKIIVVSDLAYSEITYDNYKTPSILEIKKAKKIAIEFHSLSKTYNMTGWRIGWACGNRELVSALLKVKSNIDSGIFMAIQQAAVVALKGSRKHIDKMCNLYQQRRDILIKGLEELGLEFTKPKATFYLWVKTPKGFNSLEFSRLLLEKADIVSTPGIGFGKYGEGYVRFALTVDKEKIKEAVLRLKRIL